MSITTFLIVIVASALTGEVLGRVGYWLAVRSLKARYARTRLANQAAQAERQAEHEAWMADQAAFLAKLAEQAERQAKWEVEQAAWEARQVEVDQWIAEMEREFAAK